MSYGLADSNISEKGLLQKQKLGRSNYYINTELMEVFIFRAENSVSNGEFVESVKE